MNSKIILAAAIGIFIGFAGGFFLANSINRSAGMMQPTSPSGAAFPNQPGGGGGIQPPFANMPGGGGGSGGAIAMVNDAIEKAKNEPDSFESQYNAANMYYQIDRFEEAVKYYEQANRILPDHYQTIVRLGNSNYGLRKYDEAAKWYGRALELQPDDVDVRTDFGTTFFLREQKDLDRAVKEYKTSLEKNPEHEPTLQNLCAVYLEKGDRQGLEETVAKLEKVNPQNPTIAKFRQELSMNK
jgi:tetratricopeptide (TPR) repeat protein